MAQYVIIYEWIIDGSRGRTTDYADNVTEARERFEAKYGRIADVVRVRKMHD